MSKKKLLSMLLTVAMLLMLVPATALAADEPTVTVNATACEAGVATEFTVTTTAGNKAGTMVLGAFEGIDSADMAKLEYYETFNNIGWKEMPGNTFGPAAGFPLTEGATSKFRVTFNADGEYPVTIKIQDLAGNVIASTEEVFKCGDEPTVTVDAPETFDVNVATEYSISTTAGYKTGTMVVGTFDCADFDDVVDKLEYYEVRDNTWYELPGKTFGPSTGFSLKDGTSKFRVTLKETGEYPFTIKIQEPNGNVVMTKDVTFKCVGEEPTVTVNAPEVFEVGTATEFTVSTTPGYKAGTMVVGVFDAIDPAVIEKIEYFETYNNIGWKELTGTEFGPKTGFPLMEATSKFRVTFKEAGTYNFTVKIVDVADKTKVLADTTEKFVSKLAPTLTVDIPDFFHIGEAKEFEVTTTGGSKADTMVMGSFDFAEFADAVDKIEYLESKNGQWYVLPGTEFGPPVTGFPLKDATSKFRVTFKKAGTYNFTVNVKAVADGKVVLTEEVEAVVHDVEKVEAKAPTCLEAGNIEYWYCEECDKYFKDEALTQEITKEETVIEATGHAWEDEYTVDEHATCTTEGSKSIHCANCDVKKDVRVIPAKGHRNEDGWKDCQDGAHHDYICANCGKTFVEGHNWEGNTCTYCGATRNAEQPVNPVVPTSPQTGDSTNMILWVAIAVVAMGAAGLVIKKKRA